MGGCKEVARRNVGIWSWLACQAVVVIRIFSWVDPIEAVTDGGQGVGGFVGCLRGKLRDG